MQRGCVGPRNEVVGFVTLFRRVFDILGSGRSGIRAGVDMVELEYLDLLRIDGATGRVRESDDGSSVGGFRHSRLAS